jgi:hypothetical protein
MKFGRSPFAAAKLIPVLLIAGVFAGGSYAFTASNSVASAPAGMGESSAFSGYNATTDNGTTISWTSACSLVGTISSGSGHYSCNFGTDPTVLSTTKLAVSAAN